MKTVLIVAGESSGELYGALLAKELKRIWPDMQVVGMGGERMKTAGVQILSGISGAFGITELLPSIKRIRESFKIVTRALAGLRPDVTVLIDYPDFNFRLGKVAKSYGLKVLYYVSPHVWVWRKGRVKTMGEIADKVAVILPFEEEMYREASIPCEFVGHPATEEIEDTMAGKEDSRDAAKVSLRRDLGLAGAGPFIALLPGSRPHELKTLLPVFLGFVRIFRGPFPDSTFVLPLAPNIETEKFQGYLDALADAGVVVVKGDAIRCLACSDAAVIASGTATLQAALLGVPMVVVYKVSLLTYCIGRAILNIRHISLVNILAGRSVVPELVQHEARPESIKDALLKLSSDNRYRVEMISAMNEVGALFSNKRPSRRVAGMIGEIAGWKP